MTPPFYGNYVLIEVVLALLTENGMPLERICSDLRH
jgi:hypothetical protein